MTPREALLACGAADAACLPADVRFLRKGGACAHPAWAVAAFPYYAGRGVGNLSLYARGADYHRVLTARLRTAAELLGLREYAVYADASPFREVALAAAASLGVVGDNGLLITPRYGSFVFLGVLCGDMPPDRIPCDAAGCLHCGACLAACPGGALGDTFCEQQCLSHLTQTRGALDEAQCALLARADAIWGCDRCQLCCPMNEKAEKTALPEFLHERYADLPDDACTLSDRAFRKKYADRAFSWRGNTPLRRNLSLKQTRQ